MKTILALLLVLAGLGLQAGPQFLPLPGTPEGDALAAKAAPQPTTTPAPAAVATTVVKPAAAPATNIAPATPPPAVAPAPVAPAANPAPIAATAAPAISPAAPAPTTAVPAIPAAPSRAITRRPASPAVPGVSPVTAPASSVPAAPGSSAADAAMAAGAAKMLAANPDDVLPAGTIQFQATPLEQVLEIYAKLVNRTILRPATLPTAAITIKTQTELTKTEALQALDSVLGMNGIAMIKIGTKFVKAVPIAEAPGAADKITEGKELDDVGGYITHVAQVRYAKPSEVMPVLAPFAKIQGSITALDANGILIIRDFTENVQRMLELLAKIDVAVPSEFISKVIPIKYALASDMASALNSVGGAASGSIGSSGGGTTAGAGVTGRTGTTSPFGNRTSGFGTSGINSSGGTTPYGSRSPINSPGVTPGGAAAPSFQQRLSSIISRAATGGAGDFQLIGPNKIIADERTNSLLVFASVADMEMIEKIISQLDVVLAQVLIESVILDVTLADNFQFGVSAGQAPLHDNNLTGGGAFGNNGALSTGMAFLNNLIQTGSNAIPTPTITNFTPIFSPSPTVNFPTGDGLTYFGKIGPTWNVALTALAGKNNVKVLARPSIQTSQNAPASIFVGETRPYITGTYYDGYSGGGSRSQYQQSQIGITLNVTPLINPDGLVVMDIQQQVQQVGGSVKIDGNDVPITQDQNATAKVAVRNGETIVMGGFIQNQKAETRSGVPFLQDIPWLGALFRSTSTTGQRRELLVMIRPTVLPTPEAAALNTQVQRDSHPNLKLAESEFDKEDKKLLKRANRLEKIDPDDKKAIAASDKADKAAEAKAKADALAHELEAQP